MGIKRYHDRMLGQIARGLSMGASDLHRVELERLGRRAVAACRFGEMLTDLKQRLARRAKSRGDGGEIPPAKAPPRAA